MTLRERVDSWAGTLLAGAATAGVVVPVAPEGTHQVIPVVVLLAVGVAVVVKAGSTLGVGGSASRLER